MKDEHEAIAASARRINEPLNYRFNHFSLNRFSSLRSSFAVDDLFS